MTRSILAPRWIDRDPYLIRIIETIYNDMDAQPQQHNAIDHNRMGKLCVDLFLEGNSMSEKMRNWLFFKQKELEGRDES